MRSRKGILPGLCKHRKRSPLKAAGLRNDDPNEAYSRNLKQGMNNANTDNKNFKTSGNTSKHAWNLNESTHSKRTSEIQNRMNEQEALMSGNAPNSMFTKQENDPPINMGVLPEVKLTDSYPNKKARRRGEERKLTQQLHKNPVIKAVHGKTNKAAKNIKTGVEHASTILPIGGVVKATKGTKKIFDTFNKVAKHRKKQNKLIEESLKKKGYTFGPTKSSGWTGK